MKNNKKIILLTVIGVIGVVIVMFGVAYAFFSYSKNGSNVNSISSGTIKFLFTENSTGQRGITLSDAMPMTDAQGQAQTGNNNYFDFKVTAKTGKAMSIPYTVTVRVDDSSTLDPSVVKVWLSDQTNTEIVPVKYFDASDAASRNDVLHQFTGVVYASRYNERVLYSGTVPANAQGEYIKNFRLRMWIDNATDFSETVVPAHCSVSLPENTENPQEACANIENAEWLSETTEYPYNNKTFKVTVNVYANGQVVSEDIAYNASDIGYTNSQAPGVTNVYQALTDLTTKLQ